jgi:hypothetical protein
MDAYGQIGDHMPLVKQYEELFGTDHHIRRVLALMYGDILDFHKRAIRFFSGRGKSITDFRHCTSSLTSC